MECVHICLLDCDYSRTFLHYGKKNSAFNKLLSIPCTARLAVLQLKLKSLFSFLPDSPSHLALWLFFPLLGNNLMVHPWVLLRVTVMKAHFRFFFLSSLLKTILYPGIFFMNNYDLYLPEFVI